MKNPIIIVLLGILSSLHLPIHSAALPLRTMALRGLSDAAVARVMSAASTAEIRSNSKRRLSARKKQLLAAYKHHSDDEKPSLVCAIRTMHTALATPPSPVERAFFATRQPQHMPMTPPLRRPSAAPPLVAVPNTLPPLMANAAVATEPAATGCGVAPSPTHRASACSDDSTESHDARVIGEDIAAIYTSLCEIVNLALPAITLGSNKGAGPGAFACDAIDETFAIEALNDIYRTSFASCDPLDQAFTCEALVKFTTSNLVRGCNVHFNPHTHTIESMGKHFISLQETVVNQIIYAYFKTLYEHLALNCDE